MTARTAEAAADRIAESLANESNLVLSDRDTAILRRHLRAFAEANRPVPPAGSVEAVARPDFGEDRQEFHGTVLTCKRVAPGLTLHDLVMAFERGKNEAGPSDEMAGNPSRWPVTRGVKAVTNTILDAVYGTEGQALTTRPPTTLADVPAEEREAVREILAQWQRNVGDNPTTWNEPIASFLARLDPK